MKSLATIALLMAPAVSADKCRAIAFSSGDEDAAYQAGALKGIVESPLLQAEDFAYDSVSGVSGGAVNAVILSNYTKGQEQDASARMEQFWVDATHTKLYKDWLGGITRGLFFEGGLYNPAPMEDFLKQEFS